MGTAFDAEVRASGRGSHAVVVPKTVVAALASRRVRARIGDETFEATLGTYGGRTFLGLRKAVLTALGVAAGATVHVTLEPGAATEDPASETGPVTCAELEASLTDDPALRRTWEALPAGHRAEYGRWIAVGPDADERQARVARLRHRLLPA